MKWLVWPIIALFLASMAFTVRDVGRPRKPLDSGTAATIVVLDTLLITALLTIWFNP